MGGIISCSGLAIPKNRYVLELPTNTSNIYWGQLLMAKKELNVNSKLSQIYCFRFGLPLAGFTEAILKVCATSRGRHPRCPLFLPILLLWREAGLLGLVQWYRELSCKRGDY